MAAQASGAFEGEIAPVRIKTRKGEVTIREDEQPGKARPEKIPMLKPAFREGGTVTLQFQLDQRWAAALVMVERAVAEARGLKFARGFWAMRAMRRRPGCSPRRRCLLRRSF